MLKKILITSILSLVAIGGFFGNISISNYTVGSGSRVTQYQLTIGNSAYAADCKEADKVNGKCPESTDAAKMYNQAIGALNIILEIFTIIISPVIIFASWLMSPDWTAGDLFNLRESMHKLWVVVSNIVYFIYAVMLILIALGAMFNQEKFSYKVMLPKLALGILMVPFTWMFVQVTISVASVVTASAIMIPADTLSINRDGSKWWNTPSIPRKVVIDGTSGKAKSEKDTDNSCADCMTPREFLTNSSGMYGHLLVYAYSVFNFNEVKKLPTNIDKITAGVGILHQGIIAAIMFLVFGLLTLALVAMLLVRAVKLWIYAIFSPLFTFRFVAGSNLVKSDDSDSFTLKEFIGLAFVPAIVGLILSFGLIMINAVTSGKIGNENSPNAKQECRVETLQGQGCTIIGIAQSESNSITRRIDKDTDPKNPTTITTIVFGGMTLEFKGKAGTNTSNELEKTKNMAGVLGALGGIFGTLIVDIIALLFIWLAFMAAKNVSKAVSGAVQPFEDIGNKIGGIAKSLPKYAPLPIPGGSVAGLGKTVETIGAIPDARMRAKLENEPLYQWAKRQAGMEASSKDIQELTHAIQNAKAEELRTKIRGQGAESNISQYAPAVVQNKDHILKDIARYGYSDRERNEIKSLLGDKDIATNKDKLAQLMALLGGAKKDQADSPVKARGWLDSNKSSGQPSPSTPTTPTTINLTINNKADANQIATAIQGSRGAGSITRKELEEALKAKQDADLTDAKVGDILKQLDAVPGYFKKP